jgi:ATP:ADP antiporter, AAA family
MSSPRTGLSTAVVTAMLCSAAVTAQFVAGKAARDALYLTQLSVTTLPATVMATSVVSILMVIVSSTALRRLTPSVFVSGAFSVSAVMLIAEWALVRVSPQLAAVVVYLQISGVGPILGSGFWLMVSERFDPHTAKLHFGQIAGAGTLGGLAGGFLAVRVTALFDTSAMLLFLAALNIFCAWQIRRLAPPVAPMHDVEPAPELATLVPQSGLRVLAEAPYLRTLAILVLLGTTGAALVDYVFKAQAVASFGRGEGLLRFFAGYYAAVSLITFVIQASSSRLALEKLGLGVSAGLPSVALLAGGAVSLVAPGLESAMVARGGESAFRSSLFRSGYELFYTPIPPKEKRAAKSLIDVGVERLGDALGAGLVRVMLAVTPLNASSSVLALAVGCSAAAIFVATRLNRGYIQTLERSLLNRAVELELADVEDLTTHSTIVRTLTLTRPIRRLSSEPHSIESADSRTGSWVGPATGDEEILRIMALRSKDPQRVVRALHSEDVLPASLIPHVVSLLAWDPVAAHAADALKRAAEDHVGALIDALIDPNQDFAVRRRLARVFGVCVSQRAVDGLMLGLDDQRFEVRFQCARSLLALVEKNPRVRIDRDVVFDVVRREAAVGRSIWESHRLLTQLDDRDEHFFVDDFVKDRASRSLSHVFTLLSLVLPTEPLRIAFRGLHTDDPALRGTALEYLEGVLPPPIRVRLWPFLEDGRPSARRPARPRDEIVADLVRSHDSILLNLEELQRRTGPAADGATPSGQPGVGRPGGKPWPRT